MCNTWFPKKDHQKQTWQHPQTKTWHCIDYIITSQTKTWHCIDYIVTSQRARRRCRDAHVLPTAECGSDHALLGMTFNLKICRYRNCDRRPPCCPEATTGKPFDLEKLRKDPTAADSAVQRLKDQLRDTLHETPPDSLSLSEKWSFLRDSLLASAEATLGRCHRKQPDWYCDSSSVLTPLLEQQNKSYTAWVAHGRHNDRFYCLFRAARKTARAAVRRARTEWFEKMAAEAEATRFDGARVWKSIRHLQQACRGLEPVRVTTIKDEHGIACSTEAARYGRWNRHFTNILNLPSRFSHSSLDFLLQREVQHDLDVRHHWRR